MQVYLLVPQLQHDVKVKPILHLEDLVLQGIHSLLLALDFQVVLLLRAIGSLLRRRVHPLLEPLQIFLCWTILIILFSVGEESVALLAGGVVLERGDDASTTPLLVLDLVHAKSLFLLKEEPLSDQCNHHG